MKIIRNLLLGIFVVAALCYLNLIIPHPQQTQARTYDQDHGFLAQEFPCASGNTNVIHIGDEETPDCSTGQLSDISSYRGGVNISLTNTNNWYRIHTSWGSYYCPNLSDGGGACNSAQQLTPGTIVVKPGDYIKVFADTRNDVQNMCGAIQEDMSFTADVSTDNGQTWTNNACGFGSMSNPGASNATFTHCSTNQVCQPPAQKHTICQQNACVSVDASVQGTSCNTPADNSSECSHLACGQDNSCIRVPGGNQQDTCTQNPNSCAPAPQKHNICQGMACVSVDASITGTSCNTPADASSECSHLGCNQDNSCVRIAGTGQDSCTQNPNSCQPTQHHLACVSNSCQSVTGAGQDSCTTNPDSCNPPQLTVIKVVNNNHGGTKTPSDFTLRVNGTQVANNVSNTETPGDFTVSEDSMSGYHQVSISGSCDANGHVHLNSGDSKTCIIENEDNGTNACTMPTCNTTIPGCSFPSPDTTVCSCGPMVCITQTPNQPNVTVNLNNSNNNSNNQSQNQQQQQQQAVLGASVAPAVTSSQLPKTGSGLEVLLSLVGLLPVGFKLRKLV